MMKCDERVNQGSCWNKARERERVFVLLERDKASVSTIRFWVAERIRLGLNEVHDPQITEALNLADEIEAEAAR